jgi:hypothetical protein
MKSVSTSITYYADWPLLQILKCLRVDQRLGQITNVLSIMIPQLAASGTTFATIFLFMTYIAYIFFGANLEDWSTFIFSIGSSIGALSHVPH